MNTARHAHLAWSYLARMLVAAATLGTLLCTPPQAAASRPTATPVQLAWLRVDPRQPQTLFLEGVFGDCFSRVGSFCPPWLMRSTDGGAHWTDLSAAAEGAVYTGLSMFLEPAVVAADGRHVYIIRGTGGGNAVQGEALMWSDNGGLLWTPATSHDRNWKGPGNYFRCLSPPTGYGGGFTSFALSPASDRRVYAMFFTPVGCGLARSYDGGRTFFAGTDPIKLAPDRSVYSDGGPVVADPVRLNTVYYNVVFYLQSPPRVVTHPGFAARSDDGGITWTTVTTPTATPALQGFSVGTDRHEGRLLVGYGYGPGQPKDRIYLSADEGRTWRPATCPGDLRGTCPAFTVDNVFGAGASYAFLPGGIYRFQGGGPATSRIAASDHLPFRISDLIDVQAGDRAGDPIYLLGRGSRGTLHNLLYRSTDAGHSWQPLLRGPFPIKPLPGWQDTLNYLQRTSGG